MVKEFGNLRSYFLVHPIVVQIDLPLRNVLYRLNLTGRLTKWAVELCEFEIYFEARTDLKHNYLLTS